MVGVDRAHALYTAHAVSWPIERKAGAAGGAGGADTDGRGALEAELAAVTRSAPPRIRELYGPTHYLEKLWLAQGQPKSALLPREEAEELLLAYIDKHGLGAAAPAAAEGGGGGGAEGEAEEEEAVTLDDLLIETLYKVAGQRKTRDEYPQAAPLSEVEVGRARRSARGARRAAGGGRLRAVRRGAARRAVA